MLSPKGPLLRSDNPQPGCTLQTELLKHLNRLAIVCGELDEISTWARRRERPTAPLAIIYSDRVTEVICHRDHEISRLTRAEARPGIYGLGLSTQSVTTAEEVERLAVALTLVGVRLLFPTG